MKGVKHCLTLVISFFFIIQAEISCSSALTNDFQWVGRFGDQLYGYYIAKVLSHVYEIPFLYKPICYSDQLVMSVEEKYFDQKDLHRFRTAVKIGNDVPASFELRKDNATLYTVNLYSHCWKKLLEKKGILFKKNRMMIKDQSFLQDLKQKISPLASLDLEEVYRPEDQISVAVHVRRGGGFDPPLLQKMGDDKSTGINNFKKKYSRNRIPADVGYPEKFPPLRFYVDQVKKIAAMFNNEPLYVHIFTDDKNPQALLDYFKNELKGFSLTLATRLTGNSHDKNVLEDFFGMTKFDCLVRPVSYFSVMAEIVGNHKIVISPKALHWEKEQLIVDSVEITDNRCAYE